LQEASVDHSMNLLNLIN